MIVSVNHVQVDPNDPNPLDTATQQLIQNLQKTNPGLRVARASGRVRFNGQPGLSTYLSNESTTGGQETDWLGTMPQPQGLLSFLCVAPHAAYHAHQPTSSARAC